MYLNGPDTSLALLSRLRAGAEDPEAWARFVYLYGPHLVDWCRKHGLQDADARDVTQEVLVQLARTMGRFRKDPEKRFRGWLRSVVHSALSDWVERKKSQPAGSGDSEVIRYLHQLPDRDDLARRIEEEFDRELVDVAMLRVRERVEPRTWEAFRLVAIERLSGKEAAEALGMTVGSTFAAKCRVQRLVREEIEQLDRSA
jgi:RNA polymerase sigma-70 factor (ECF subfamily)